ncbi:MAG: hypothetical protein Kow0042_11470 [Calditrichia bacterium]
MCLIRILPACYRPLEIEYVDRKLLRASWPWEAWLSEYIGVPVTHKFTRRILALYNGDILQHETTDKVARQLYFNHLLFVSEVARKKDSLLSQETIHLRQQIKEVNPHLFEKYMQKIR